VTSAPGPLRALTVWQPWASLIVAGAKPYEFRKWRSPRGLIGQRIVIHAAARPVDMAEVEDLRTRLVDRDRDEECRRRAAECALHAEGALPVLEAALRGELPLAAGVGTAVLGESTYALGIAWEFGLDRVNDSPRDEHMAWAWPMSDPDPWPHPVPMRGYQGCWTWPDPSLLLSDPGLVETPLDGTEAAHAA